MGGIWASNNKSRASVTLIIKFRDSPERGGHFEESPTEILQRTRFYKDRDSTKNEILQNEEGTLKKARPRFYTIGALRPMGGLWASSNKSRAPFTLIIKFTGADSSPSKSSNSQHRIHRAWTLCLTRCTRCTSEATKKREYRSPRPISMFPMILATAQRC